MTELTETRALRVVQRGRLSFAGVTDPRCPRGTRFGLDGLLRLHVAAFASGKQTLRAIESFASDLSHKALRLLGFQKAPADTTLYDLDSRLSPEGLREVLWQQVRSDLDSKAITNDIFQGGVLTLDGKGCGSGMGEAPNEVCRSSVCDAAGTKYWDVFALRAVLTSSTARPAVDQELIDGKHGEATTFGPMVQRIVERFPKLFRYITVDAGLASAHNAKLVISLGKVYVFGIKGNFRRLFPVAQQLLKDAEVVACTSERAQGCWVVRELRRVHIPESEKFPGATQLWGVRQIRTTNDGRVETEDRVFITNAPWDELLPESILKLVRLHWGIENNANWTADLVFAEDTQCPCRAGKGVLVLSWLRLLAYNVVAVFRAHLPKRDRYMRAWERCRELIYQAWLFFGRCLALVAADA
jgi:hypothetical protein